MAGNGRVERPAVRGRFDSDERTIYAARARRLGLPFASVVHLGPEGAVGGDVAAIRNGSCAMAAGGNRALYMAPEEDTIRRIEDWLDAHPLARDRLYVATPSAIRTGLIEAGAKQFLDSAINSLDTTHPQFSARIVATRRQAVVGPMLALAIGAALCFDWRATLLALSVAAAIFFIVASALRLVAAVLVSRDAPPRGRPATGIAEADLPIYSVLVPLYREAGVAADLIAALGQMDWPAERLDIKLIVEADDAKTRQAVEAAAPGPPFEIVVVPAARPRTKPKALNFALPLARGRYVTVYDAEDRPHPGQLREAYATFERSLPAVACLQAPLIIDNGQASGLARFFAVEYSALFDGLLPALARLDLPVPLGGTSNHFRREALEAVGGWDPYNVTEDADLGLRLSRLGFRTKTIRLPTFEEAPTEFVPWLKQRSRWFKGWMHPVN